MRLWYLAVCLLALAAWPLAARAEHARIDLKVIHLDPDSGAEGEDAAAAISDQEPPREAATNDRWPRSRLASRWRCGSSSPTPTRTASRRT